MNDNELDGCAVDMTKNPTPDEDVDGILLFADVDPTDVDAIEKRVAEWKEVFSWRGTSG